ncbi:MAG: bifunctional (p)ppGpp synthetase/guanosine-3',5'-bis(diphosphate) 3'-pyrophosphohydrolase [Alphaproteobacteria bacterium]|nr:bifunctional (p)ppGpp synthetase/guanosine-3',5'-bis(diphosphate) 3'-pyrophosphohydrolase [Alphaproteobacteria bacterium]
MTLSSLVPVEVLIEKMKKHLPKFDEALLRKGYNYGLEKHGKQMRHSGELYFSHPIAVAEILIEQHLDLETVVTGLLHDVLEDTPVSEEEMTKEFGESITFLVKGVTKLAKVKLQSDKLNQAENFRKFILAVSKDLRVLITKLADRLHNMRTLEFHPDPEKRRRKSLEVMEVYAPLADRIGMNQIKDELELLAFENLEPESYERIQKDLEQIRQEGQDLVLPITEELKNLATENHIDVEVFGREKSVPAIWKKMQRKGLSFDRVFDIMAFRYIAKDLTDCYRILGLIHGRYAMVPGRFKDYISTPKPNGYQSIHTTVVGPFHTRIEIQIRTEQMHEVAEFGIAAHWAYKEGVEIDKSQVFFNSLVEALQSAENMDEFFEHTKIDSYTDGIFCFSPHGDLLSLPYEATALDFAYEIHSEIGNTCIGAKVNRKIVSLPTILKTGDQVEIMTSKSQEPRHEWLKFVVASKSKSYIRRYLRQKKSDEMIQLGRQMVKFIFEEEGLEWKEKAIVRLLPTLRAKTLEEIYAHVGEGLRSPESILYALYPDKKHFETTSAYQVNSLDEKKDKKEKAKSSFSGLSVKFAGCCHPLIGNPIKGVIHTGSGITVHKASCPEVTHAEEIDIHKVIDLKWDNLLTEDIALVGRIQVICDHQAGALNDVTQVIASHKMRIHDIHVVSRSVNFVEFMVDIETLRQDDFDRLVVNLRMMPRVCSVTKI